MAPPLYPGYYPGTPQPRYQPPTGGGQIEPTEFNMDQILRQIDSVSADYDQMGANAPKWVYDRIIDDWQQSFKASILPVPVNPEDLDDYSAESLPGGAGVRFNLNPVDIIKDPQKWATNTIKDWAKTTVNWQDLDTRYRQRVWKDVFQKEPNIQNVFEETAAYALGDNIDAQGGFKGPGYQTTDNPLRLYGRDIYIPVASKQEREFKADLNVTVLPDGTVKTQVYKARDAETKGGIDVMAEFADSVAKYETETFFGPRRESARDKVDYNGYRAVVTEMKHNEAAKSVIAGDINMQRTMDIAEAKLGIYDSMNSISEDLGNYEKKLKEAAINKKPIDTDLASKLQFGDPTKNIKSVRDKLDQIDKQISDLEAKGFKEHARHLRETYANPYRKQIEGVLTSPAVIPSQVGSMNINSAIKNFSLAMGGSGSMKRAVKEGRILEPSHPRSLLREMDSDLTRPGGKTYALGGLVHKVVKEDPQAASRAVVGSLVFVRNTADINAAMDIVSSLESGKFMEKYVWDRMKNYFPTPGALTQRYLERHNYFGIKVEDDARFENSVIYRMSNVLGSKEVPSKAFGNYFSIHDNFANNETLSKQGIALNARFYGGSHFKAVGPMADMIKLNGWDKNPKALAEFMKIIDITKGEQGVIDALKNLDQNSPWMIAFASKYGYPKFPPSVKDAELYNFMKDLQTFKKWIHENKGRLNINVDESNEGYYLALFTALNKFNNNPDFINITKRFAGVLERVYVQVNRIQTFLYKSVLGKILMPAAYLKRAITDAISTGITRILQLAASAGSGGALAPLAAVIEPLVRFVVRLTVDKVSEYVKLFYNAIVHADIDGVFKAVDKQVERASKVAMIVIGAFTMLIVMPGDAFMGAIATTFSPVDNTLSVGIEDVYGGASRGDGVELKPIATKPSSGDDCFEFADFSGQQKGKYPLSQWPSEFQTYFDSVAIPALKAVSGGYIQRLCAAGTIYLAWSPDTATSGFCGIAYSGESIIVFGHNAYCYSQTTYPDYFLTHLFAHETGHIYDGRVGQETFIDNGVSYSFSEVTANGEGPFLTYPGHCDASIGLDPAEDFAETIGNWVVPDGKDCHIPRPEGTCNGPVGTFWGTYKNHCNYADKVLTRP